MRLPTDDDFTGPTAIPRTLGANDYHTRAIVGNKFNHEQRKIRPPSTPRCSTNRLSKHSVG